MRIIAAGSLIAIVGFAASYANAGTHVAASRDRAAAILDSAKHDPPKPTLVQVPDVKVQVTYERVLRSCCRPPDLVLEGRVTNSTSKPINYVKLEILFRGDSGRIVYRENAYNLRAVTLGEDEETRQILGDTAHFDPLPAGATDTFAFSIPLPVIPYYKTADLEATEIARPAEMAQAH